jgi:phage shock protein PspC (stress-responsive transcriptional regulator)
MKKVEKVSIAEISFTLDSDAYVSLKQYLDSLHDYYDKDPDGREITRDIEARIAELILERQVYTKVVSLPLIDTIIAQLGTPRQFDDDAPEGAANAGFSGTGAGAGAGYPSDGSIPRRLHRSHEGQIFGGVCSGIARYFDINVAWVRLAFLLPLLFRIAIAPFHWWWGGNFFGGWSWVLFVTYIVLWIALPMARTPRQKLEARGEKITPESIRQNLQGAVNTPEGRKAASVAAELVTVLGRVMLFFVKFVAAVVGFSLLFAAIGMLICMMAVLFDPVSISLIPGETILTVLEGMRMLSPLMFVELVLLCVMLPLMVIGMALLSFTFGWKLGRIFYSVTLGAWGVAIILAGIVSASNARFFHNELPDRVEQWEERFEGNGRWERHEHREWRWDRHDGRWRREHIRVRAADDSLENSASADSVGSADRDALENGDPANSVGSAERDALENGTSAGSVGSADPAPEATNEVEGRKRIEIRRVD